jgi:ribonuclease BN (tRNA processing enzyme)
VVAPAPISACTAASESRSTFELSVLGSGGPASSGRAASGYVVSIDRTPRILIDAGPGAFVRLGEMGIDLEHLDTILLTHLHIDHAGDVPGFVKSRDLSYDHALTFRFFGPEAGGEYPSTRAFLEGLFGAHGAFAYLPKFRNVLTLEPHDLPTRADAPIQDLVREKDVHVTSVAVDHDDVPAVAYRVEHGGHAVVVSGDLASKNDNLIRLARDADLLVYDAAVRDPPASAPGLYALHTPPRRIGEVAAAAHVRAVLLSHVTPGVEEAQDEVLRSIRASYAGPVRFATDCMRVDLATAATSPPRRSDATPPL